MMDHDLPGSPDPFGTALSITLGGVAAVLGVSLAYGCYEVAQTTRSERLALAARREAEIKARYRNEEVGSLKVQEGIVKNCELMLQQLSIMTGKATATASRSAEPTHAPAGRMSQERSDEIERQLADMRSNLTSVFDALNLRNKTFESKLSEILSKL